ncbi:hypothetical protein FPV67DRAFT_101470 [Lyophyllum atratum]|nr:hypothetical protein FPV67DRAFT_101470 [Lyophyllum atratum]
MASTNLNGTDPAQPPAAAPGLPADVKTLADDITRLESLLSQSELSTSEGADVAELLQRLDNANGVAGSLEDKLDGILAKLDGILDSMDPEKTDSVEVSVDVTDIRTSSSVS